MFFNDNIEMQGSASTPYGWDGIFSRPARHWGAHNEMKVSTSTFSDRTR